MTGDLAGPGGGRGMDGRAPPPGAEDLARRLMAHEAKGGAAPADLVPAGERVLRRLRADLVPVLGTDGFSALERRALDLTRRRYAFLAPDPSGNLPRALEDVRGVLAGRDQLEARDALQAVCAHLIGLLVIFLGEPLTMQFIRLAWPDLPEQGVERHERETR